MKRLLPLLLFLLIPMSTRAQDDKDWTKMSDQKRSAAPTSVTPPQTQDLNERIKAFRNSGRFSVKYNKFEDYTHVRVGPFFIGGTSAYIMSGRQLEMSASFIKEKGPVNTVYLLFRAEGKDWTFLKDRDLYALVDGERMSLGEGERDSDIRLGLVSELIVFGIPLASFAKIANAKSAELKVGRIELTLKDEHKEAFRDLLSLLK